MPMPDSASKEPDANPEGPLSRPSGSRIERRQPVAHRLVFHLPAHGRWGPWLFVAIPWNVLSVLVVSGFFAEIGSRQDKLPLTLGTCLFVIAGIALIYHALRHRYGSTLLELAPESIRLQRALLWVRKTDEVPTAEVRRVAKVQLYTRNYQPLYGIEIDTPRRRIRFGSSFTDDEKDWLCWEIQEFLRAHASQPFVAAPISL
jgi:hypothetical protein